MINTIDEKYIKLCFDLAKGSAGRVSPNPLVGSVIVKDGQIISTGRHQKYGEAHAERNAINSAKQDLTGAALYCNLEPCMHTDKQTPPCVPAIISSGITKVVISNVDSNAKVNGKGIKNLREAGLDVVSGVLEKEGKELNRFFFKYIETGMPYITVKIASSSDGKISAAKGTQTWLTGEESQIFVHQQRAIYDAVLVGANTINVDNPQLSVRKVEGRNPIRIILDGNLSSNVESKVFNDEDCRTLVFCSKLADEKKKNEFVKRKIDLIELEPEKNNVLSIEEIMTRIAKENISSVFIEGGSKIFSQFIARDLFDEIIVLKAPLILKSGVETIDLDAKKNLILYQDQKLGKDIKQIYRLRGN